MAMALMLAQTVAIAQTRVRMTFAQLGSVDIVLDANTPLTEANFLGYVDTSAYNSTVIHRSDQTDSGCQVIQGGGYIPNATDPTQEPAEIAQRTPSTFESTGLSNVKYTIGAASTAAQGPMSSQWYFNMGNNSDLDPSYCAFGTVVGGTSVLDSIFALSVYNFGSSTPFSTVPLFPTFSGTGYPATTDWVTLASCIRTQSLGDFNQDGKVDASDYTIWANNLGKIGAAWMAGDANGDGLVDVADYNIWAANDGSTAPSYVTANTAVSPAPEPATLSLLALAALAFLRQRTKRR
jgi:MYXO-CTERM domain-containing protein